MRLAFGFIVSLAAAVLPALAEPSAPARHHPLLGIWRYELPDRSCAETYHFRADGTTLVTSAAEVSESEYLVPAAPSQKGYYKLVDRVVRDNGKRDCAGEITKVGTTATNFIRFHPAGSLFLMCTSESLEACIGPFRRVPGEGT
jgi:hypothetical protein